VSSRGKKKNLFKYNLTKRKPRRFLRNLSGKIYNKTRELLWGIFYIGDYQSCGFYRSIFPMLQINLNLNHPKYKINIMEANRIIRDPNLYRFTNFIQIQRWDSIQHIDGMNYFLKMKINNPKLKIIYDIDDDIYSLPDYNYFKLNGFEKRIRIMEEIMKYSDRIFVSTPKLKDVYKHLNKNILVVDNYLPKWLWGEPEFCKTDFKEKKKVMRILWAGSGTHFSEKNLGDLKNICKLVNKTKNKYFWIFMGAIPPGISSPNIFFIPWKTMLELPLTYKSIQADVAVAPLELNAFNKSKSNIKAKEYTAAGFPGIYSNIEPYKNLSNTFSCFEEFEDLLNSFYNSYEKRFNSWKKDYKILEKEMFIEDNIAKRIDSYV